MDSENEKRKPKNVRGTVREEYGRIARQEGSCRGPSSCCGSSPADSVAASIGYSEEELDGLPEGANMGLSCGNPKTVLESVQALVGCIAGAMLVEETRDMVKEAGLIEAVFDSRSNHVNQMAEWSDPLYREIAGKLPPGNKPSDFVASLNITALKPKKE